MERALSEWKEPVPSTVAKYLAVETAMSALCNGILNFGAAYAIFHAHSAIPTTAGPHSLLRDSIGEAFIASFLSVLVPSLLARKRMREGTLPVRQRATRVPARNPYVRSLLIALLFTAFFVPVNALLLPRLYPESVSLRDIVLFKTVFGTLLGGLATLLALHKVVGEY